MSCDLTLSHERLDTLPNPKMLKTYAMKNISKSDLENNDLVPPLVSIIYWVYVMFC